MKPLPDWLILCVWRSLLGEVYPSLRAVALSLADDKTLLIRYYLDREPISFDWESLEVLATNISASSGHEQIHRINLDCKFDLAPIGSLDYLDGFVYCRREYSV